MPKYVFAYRAPKTYVPSQEEATLEAWNEFRTSLGDAVLDFGNPVFTRATVGTCDESTGLGGYSFVTAEDLEAALSLANGSPLLAAGGGVEVGEITEIM